VPHESLAMIKRLRTTGTALALVALAGCSTVNQFMGKEESIDYKSAQAARPSLTVPPDLTQVPGNSRYSVPGNAGTATYSDYATEQARRQARAGDEANAAVLPQRDDMRMARDGELRWLVVNMPATDVFNQAVEDRKSTRLNSSHVKISYAVFCLKKKIIPAL